MCFVCQDEIEWEQLDWGDLGWVISPQNVADVQQLTVLDVKLEPGGGHDFHRHPEQEEIIFVRSGAIEQWVLDERKDLGPGDTAFVPKGAVHASFVDPNATEPARLLVVLGPSAGETGYVTEDVSNEEPWVGLRA